MEALDIVDAIRSGWVRITDHADEEAQNDRLSYEEIFFSVFRGEIIENYPDDKPYPSCLVYGHTSTDRPVHSVWAYNEETRWAGSVYSGIPTRSCEVDKLARKEEMLMRKKKPFDKCPICGGVLEEKEVEKLLKGGVHTAIMKVRAEVCLHCGERLYSQEVVRRFEEVRRKLEREEVSAFKLRGKAFQVA